MSDRSEYRLDIQGLRGVAVILVLLWHAEVPGISAGFVGVDAFFVISGFLITGLLLKERRHSGRIGLIGFYGRRAKRLLPAATFATIATMAGTWLFLPATRWSAITADGVASTLYFQNWRLASRAVDYQAQDAGASPFQHYWSLSVEEQFYLFWPLLLLVFLPAGAVSGGRMGRKVTAALVVAGVPSLVYALSYTYSDPARAYFATTTRVWQFAAGAAVAGAAVWLGRLRLGLARTIGWLGAASLVAAALLIDTADAYPGWPALAPTLGTAAIIVSGLSLKDQRSVGGPLSWGPLVFVGTISYSLYLWHWPFLVFADAKVDDLTWPVGVVVVTASAVPAYLSYRLLEDPLRRAARLEAPAPALVVGAVFTVGALLAGLGLRTLIPESRVDEEVVAGELEAIEESIAGLGTTPPSTAAPSGTGSVPPSTAAPAGPGFGAQALLPDPFAAEAATQVELAISVTPDPVHAVRDKGDLEDCMSDGADTSVIVCRRGDPGGAVSVALIGDSHAQQWATAFATIAEQEGWDLRIMTRGGCSYTFITLAFEGRRVQRCTDFNENLRDELLSDPPDVVVTTGRDRPVFVGDDLLELEAGRPALAASYVEAWTELSAQGIQVVALADTPIPPTNPVECVVDNLNTLGACAFARTQDGQAIHLATQQTDQAVLLDMNRWVCPLAECPVVIGGVLVYRDAHHVSDTYIRTMTPQLYADLLPLMSIG